MKEYTNLLKTYLGTRIYMLAGNVFSRARLRPNPQTDPRVKVDVVLFTQALGACVEARHLKLAQWVATMMRARGVEFNSHVYLALLEAGGTSSEGVMAVMELMKKVWAAL
jgi:hypothetical protein